MASTPDQTLQAFFDVFASGAAGATKVANLMNLFCQNNPAANPTIPAVGIGHHGPDFIGRADVESLWHRFLVDSFQNFMFAPADIVLQPGSIAPPRLYSKPTYPTQPNPIPMIGIQCTLSGKFFELWFQRPPAGSTLKDHSSNPLSGIHTRPSTPIPVTLEASAVFAFDTSASSLITNVFVYLDRYLLMHVLNPGVSELLAGYNEALVKRKEAFDRLENQNRKYP